MSSFAIIIGIVLLLFACVFVITVIQKREEEKARLRQKIAQHRYRSNQASAILSNFSQLPIGPEARQMLLQYSLANLQAIKQLNAKESNIDNSIEMIKQNLQNLRCDADSQRLTIPNDLTVLTTQVNRLSNLAKFILKINKLNICPPNLAPVAVNRIMTLISESKICAYIQQGKESLSKHEYVPAQRSFIMAQQMMHKIPEKNERIKKLEMELHELIRSSPTDALNTQLSFNQPTGENKDEEDALFGPRKKW